jgi:Ca-activated chloride channel family protein
MLEALVTAAAVLLAALAELLHGRRVRRVAGLLFGPSRRPAIWARTRGLLRVLGAGLCAFGLVTLWTLPPKVHKVGSLPEGELQHLVLVLDVSPSMRLVDAGPTQQESRMHRARDVLESFFQRVPVEQYRISVVATYNGAKPVVVDTSDLEVVRNILGDLPMHHAFKSGQTDIFAGLTEGAKIAEGWPPDSAILLLVSDGDTVPALGMPKLPASVRRVLVVGVGDPITGRFLDGRQSRQDRSTLRQVATRLHGVYHDANAQHLSTDTLEFITATAGTTPFEKLTRRDYALIALAVGSALLALLPLLLHRFGTRWRPGVPRAAVAGTAVASTPARQQAAS